MLKVNSTNNIAFTSKNIVYAHQVSSFGNNPQAKKAYLDMNKSVYLDYVDGDISLARVLANKLKNFWHIAFHKDPLMELKAQVIEESLKQNAQERLHFRTIA